MAEIPGYFRYRSLEQDAKLCRSLCMLTGFSIPACFNAGVRDCSILPAIHVSAKAPNVRTFFGATYVPSAICDFIVVRYSSASHFVLNLFRWCVPSLSVQSARHFFPTLQTVAISESPFLFCFGFGFKAESATSAMRGTGTAPRSHRETVITSTSSSRANCD
jgi:hypothetical protein